MMFADDVVLCAREKDVMELELEQWREASPSLIINAPRNMKIVTTSTIFPPSVTSSISPVVLTFVFRTFRYRLVSLLVFVTLSMISMSFVPTITVMLSAYIKFLTTSTCADSSLPFAQSFCHYFL